jgi:phage terminase large subunit
MPAHHTDVRPTFNVDPRIFNPIYLKHCFRNHSRIQIRYGGSSSGKSKYTLGQETVLNLLGGHNYLVLRKVDKTIKKSVDAEVCAGISEMNLKKYFKTNKSEMTVDCRLNDCQAVFSGQDDPEKIKSIRPKKGVFTRAILEEATEFERGDLKQIQRRLRGEISLKKCIILLFNPILKSHWIYDEFFKGLWQDDKQYMERGGVSILKTTYKDNRFLSKDDIDVLENETDKYWHDVYTLGNWGILGNLIYTNWEVRSFDKFGFDSYNNGLDWGFSKDQFAVGRFHLDFKKKELYVCGEIYERGLTNKPAAERTLELIGKDQVVADSAEPKSIVEFQGYGVNIIGAPKGKGSIEYDIKWLQQFKIIIHPDCYNFQNEIAKYKWIEDKNGNVLPKPVDKDNHLCFVAGTLITTQRGQIPIEKITINDKVLTPIGWRNVLASGFTGIELVKTYKFSNGKTLVCTPKHKIFAHRKGFAPIDCMRYGIKIYPCQKNHILFLMGKSIVGTAYIMYLLAVSLMGAKDYMLLSGKVLTGVFQRATMYTIKIWTKLITKLKTLKYLNVLNTSNSIEKNGVPNDYKNKENGAQELGHLQKHGTQAQKVKRGIKSMEYFWRLKEKNLKQWFMSVISAIKNIPQQKLTRNFVLIIVSLLIDVQDILTILLKPVLFAAKNFLRININLPKPAVILVGISSDTEVKRKVYNLTVKDCAAYFANGILVRNCDCLRYAFEFENQHLGFAQTDKVTASTETLIEQYKQERKNPNRDFAKLAAIEDALHIDYTKLGEIPAEEGDPVTGYL